MTVMTHLLTAYRPVYLWFWAVMGLFLTAIVLSFEVFGPYVDDPMGGTIWQGSVTQAPRWFLFVIGIMLTTVNLPVVIANGITRRDYFAGATAFVAVSAAIFALLSLAGFGFELAAFDMKQLTRFLPENYPLDSVGVAVTYLGESFLALAGFMLSGLGIGLLYYRLRVWVAIPLSAVMLLPVAGASLPPETATPARFAALAGGLLLVSAGGFLLLRTVPVRPKKA